MKVPPFRRKCSICGKTCDPKIVATHRKDQKTVYICGNHTREEARKALGYEEVTE